MVCLLVGHVAHEACRTRAIQPGRVGLRLGFESVQRAHGGTVSGLSSRDAGRIRYPASRLVTLPSDATATAVGTRAIPYLRASSGRARTSTEM